MKTTAIALMAALLTFGSSLIVVGQCCGGGEKSGDLGGKTSKCIDKMADVKGKEAPADPAKIAGENAIAKEKRKAPQTECPVMGAPIDKSLYADVNGKRIYVCCGSCIAKVKADPEKYIKILESKGVEIEKVPAGSK